MQKINENEKTSLSIANKAWTLLIKGEHGKADHSAKKSLKLLDNTSPEGWPLSLRVKGSVAWHKGKLAKAGKLYSKAVKLRRKQLPISVSGLVQALDDFALAEYYCQRHENALALRAEALQLASDHQISDRVLLRRLRRRLAQSYQSKGYVEHAEQMYLQCRPESEDDLEDHIGWLNAMALVNEDKGNVAASAKWFDEVIDLLDDAGEADGLVAALGNATQTRIDLGHISEAAGYFYRLKNACIKDHKLSSRLTLLQARTAMLIHKKRYQVALKLALRAEDLFKKATSSNEIPLEFATLRVMILRLSKRCEEALAFGNSYLPPIAECDETSITLLMEVANLHVHLGDFEKAWEVLEKAYALDIGGESHLIKWRIFSLLADAAHLKGKHNAAILFGKFALAFVRLALRELGEGELESWLEPRRKTYEQILNRLTLVGRELEAIQLQLHQNYEATHFIRSYANEDRDIDEIPLRKGEAVYWKRYQSFNDSMRKSIGDLKSKKKESSKLAAKELLREIFDEKFVEAQLSDPMQSKFNKVGEYPQLSYLYRNNELVGILNIMDEPEFVFTVEYEAALVAGMVRELRNKLQIGHANWLPVSAKLYDLLLRPIEKHLSASHLEIVASEFASLIPFPALYDGRHLLIEKTAPYLKTGNKSHETKLATPEKWQVAAFGTTHNNSLIEAVNEVKEVAELSGGQYFVEDDFSISAFKNILARNFNLVHLATHFDYQVGNPHRSTLLFGNNYWYTIDELAAMNIDFFAVSLLILSGCETGVSDSLDIGVEGLAGQLQALGAQNVIATQWKVHDRSARSFMNEFYGVLLSSPTIDAARALAAAQARMFKNSNKISRDNASSQVEWSGKFTYPGSWDYLGYVIYAP